MKSSKKIEHKEQVVETLIARNRKEWREWLEANHEIKQSVWLIYHKKKSNIETVKYSEAVDEALCFGWIDSKSKSIDEDQYMQFFCKRKKNSTWSRVNKEKIVALTEAGLMTQAGYQVLEDAKQNGSWTILDEVESLIIPQDLEFKFNKSKTAKSFFVNLSRSDQRNILQWLVLAKTQETRNKRMDEIVSLAEKNLKPKQFMPVKKQA
jgi:uncharacterized protein YdeI (YjbR/CyaY-like superfamily)